MLTRNLCRKISVGLPLFLTFILTSNVWNFIVFTVSNLAVEWCVTKYLYLFVFLVDIDECEDPYMSNCLPEESYGLCINMPGTFHCECMDGYQGNGMTDCSGELCFLESPIAQVG